MYFQWPTSIQARADQKPTSFLFCPQNGNRGGSILRIYTGKTPRVQTVSKAKAGYSNWALWRLRLPRAVAVCIRKCLVLVMTLETATDKEQVGLVSPHRPVAVPALLLTLCSFSLLHPPFPQSKLLSLSLGFQTSGFQGYYSSVCLGTTENFCKSFPLHNLSFRLPGIVSI